MVQVGEQLQLLGDLVLGLDRDEPAEEELALQHAVPERDERAVEGQVLGGQGPSARMDDRIPRVKVDRRPGDRQGGDALGPKVASHRLFGRFFTANRLARAQRFFDKWGAGAILLGRFVMGLRAAIFLTAGTLRMGFWRFFFWDSIAALISVPLWILLGYKASENWEEIHKRISGWVARAA